MRSLAILALCLGAVLPASAQPDPEPYLPLDEGNRWVYVTGSNTLYSNLVFLNRYARTGTTEWVALGTREVGGEMLPAVRITETTSLGAVTETECVVRAGLGGAFRYDLARLDDGSPCRAGFFRRVPERPGEIDPFSPAFETTDELIGGITYPARDIARGVGASGANGVSIRLVEDIGLTTFGVFENASTSYSNWPATLRYAEVGGETYGSPLDLAESLTPFAPGNEWVYAVSSTAPGAPEFVVWKARDGSRLSVFEVAGGEAALACECRVSIQAASASTSWVRRVTFADAPGETCPTSVAALPRLVRYAARPFETGYEVPEVTPGQVVTVGSTTLTTSTYSQEYVRFLQEDVFRLTSSFTAAEGLGVTQFANEELGGGVASTATLVYARIGGETYGERPPSAVIGDGPLPTGALGARLGPNPARDASTLRLKGRAAAARVILLDRLGRRVRTVEASVPGAVRIATAGLAAGVYVVRVETDGETLTRRLVVAR